MKIYYVTLRSCIFWTKNDH